MAKLRPKKHDRVEITFYDHCENGDDAMTCTVWGKIVANNRRAYTVRTWETDGDDSHYNRHQFVIVKSAITDIKILLPKQV